ncbi:Lachesin [Halotydeus destructor]|nr:Lachesin [Halotydeus destructor]
MFILGLSLLVSQARPTVGQIDGQSLSMEDMRNQTVPVGRDAIFQCTIDNLQNHQVAWYHKELHTLLALNERVINSKSGRLRVTRATSTFYLHIQNVHEADEGTYVCQVNSSPMKSQTGHLQVVVPPRFVEHLTSSDTEVREDSGVSLRCEANGFPSPEIKWRREDGHHINIQSPNAKRVSPLVWTPDQLIGAPIGSDVTLECNLESHPHAVTYWTRNNGQQIITSSAKYDSIIVEGFSSSYKSEMRLKIKDLRPEDLGSYTCVAKNSLGEARGTIKVYEIPRPSTQASDVMLYTSASKEFSNRRNKYYIGTKSSVAFEDNDEREKMNKAIVLTDPSSEHITIQSEYESYSTPNSEAKENHGHPTATRPALVAIFPLVLFVLFNCH